MDPLYKLQGTARTTISPLLNVLLLFSMI
jgi:hypothetical protein